MVKSECVWHDPPVAYSVSCAGGDCHGHIFSLGHDLFKTEKEAVEAWNERAEADEIEKLRAAFRIVSNSTGCCESCECWRKLRTKARAALGEKE